MARPSESRMVLGHIAEAIKVVAEDLEHACAEGDAAYVYTCAKAVVSLCEDMLIDKFGATVFLDETDITDMTTQRIREISADSNQRFDDRHRETFAKALVSIHNGLS